MSHLWALDFNEVWLNHCIAHQWKISQHNALTLGISIISVSWKQRIVRIAWHGQILALNSLVGKRVSWPWSAPAVGFCDRSYCSFCGSPTHKSCTWPSTNHSYLQIILPCTKPISFLCLQLHPMYPLAFWKPRNRNVMACHQCTFVICCHILFAMWFSFHQEVLVCILSVKF